MTVNEAAKQLEVKRSTIYALCADGQLGHVRIGFGRGTIRIDQSDIDAYKAAAREKTKARIAPKDPHEGFVFKHIKPQA